MGALHRLTAAAVARLKKPGMYPDGGNLYLQIRHPLRRSWIFRYTPPHGGPERYHGLGAAADVTLAEAREAARACRNLLRAGIDPIAHAHRQRTAAKLDAARNVTFKECATAYVAAHAPGWRNAKHAKQWTATLATYAYPVLGTVPVADIDTPLVCQVLEPIWLAKTETASRVRGRIEAVLNYGKAKGYRSGENPARWHGHLDQVFAGKNDVAAVAHHAALDWRDLPAFMKTLRRYTSVSARCLEFVILTACRTGEAIGATWPEIDIAEKAWTIAGTRMKSGREHRVPLPDRCLEILAAMPRDGDYVFPGAKAKVALSNMALLQLLRGMDRRHLTVHGFRACFRTWAAEATSYPRELCEAALAHVVRDKVEASYQRGDLFEKRRRLMKAWADYAASPVATPAGVATIRGRT